MRRVLSTLPIAGTDGRAAQDLERRRPRAYDPLPAAHPPTDRRVVNAEVVGDLLLGVPTLEVRAGDAGGVLRVRDDGCRAKGVLLCAGRAESRGASAVPWARAPQ